MAIDGGLIADFTSAQRAELDKWYRDWAYKLTPSTHHKMNGAFKDWDNDDYTLIGHASCCTATADSWASPHGGVELPCR